MKILLLGATGQVGWELQRSLSILGEVSAHDRTTANLENIDQIEQLIRTVKPSVIVNAAAYTAVDKAETDIDRARIINAGAVKAIAGEAKKLDAWLLHYSTDYVFGDSKTSAYFESDPTNPKNVYGQTKREGEEAIEASGCKHLIFRTSWVYAARGANFVKTVLRLAKDREELRIIADQVGAPTSAELIADVTALALSKVSSLKDCSGIYHLVSSGEASWHDFAVAIIKQASASGLVLKTTPDRVVSIPTTDYPLPAKRPLNSRLNTFKLQETFGVTLPSWHVHLKRTIEKLLEGKA